MKADLAGEQAVWNEFGGASAEGGTHLVETLPSEAYPVRTIAAPLSYCDIEELFRERGLAVDHSTLNRWILAYAADRASVVILPQAALQVDSR